jgi:hypothetical protein
MDILVLKIVMTGILQLSIIQAYTTLWGIKKKKANVSIITNALYFLKFIFKIDLTDIYS